MENKISIKAKARILNYVLFFLIFLVIWVTLYFVFENLEDSYKGMISAFVSVILSPRLNEYKTQSGSGLQLKWIFIKKVISL